MLKSFTYRIKPTKTQTELIQQHINSSRFIYNLALETKITAWTGTRVNFSCFDLIKQLPDLKKDCIFLNKVNSQSLQSPIRNLDAAFNRFFSGTGRYPVFKKKQNSGKFNIPQNVRLNNDKLVIPKFKEGIDIILHRPIKGQIRQATITKTETDKYFVSILCETGDLIKEKPIVSHTNSIGIDLGIKTYLVTSDGVHYDNPKFLRKYQSKVKYLQRKISKHNSKKYKRKLNILHEKIKNSRHNFLHNASTNLVNNHDTIAIETLKVCNMVKNHSLSQSILDASWSTFVNMLEYKTEWSGVNLLKIGTFEPSSKTCSCCGNVNKQLTLKDRKWTCVKCETVLDRDLNAAINIKNFALNKYLVRN